MDYEPCASKRTLLSQLAFFLIWVGVTAIGLYLQASPHGHGTHQQLGLMPCGSVILFDRPCPGCGLTTSFTAVLHGQMIAAFKAHPLGPILYLLFTVSAVAAGWGFFTGQRLTAQRPWLRRALLIFAVLFVGFGVIRWIAMPGFGSVEDAESMKKAGIPQLHRGKTESD